MTTFAVLGSDVISDPTVATTPGGGTGGSVTLTDGTQIFPDGSVVVFTATGTTGRQELNPSSNITRIDVYADGDAYRAGTPLYSYVANTSGAGDVGQPPGGIGDTFFTVDTTGLVATSPLAPSLDGLFVAPGSDAGDNIGSLTLTRHTDIDFNGDGLVRGNPEQGNGLFYTGYPDCFYICFTPGALILTADGLRPVETLRVGDRVVTRDDGMQEIRWVGSRRVERPAAGGLQHRPVLVRAGALGDGLPHRDLVLSPNHRLLLTEAGLRLTLGSPEVLVAAKHLAARPGFERIAPESVTYVHIMFDRHEVILADGAWTESFQPGDWSLEGVGAAQREEILALFPELRDRPGGYGAARPVLRRAEALLLTT